MSSFLTSPLTSGAPLWLHWLHLSRFPNQNIIYNCSISQSPYNLLICLSTGRHIDHTFKLPLLHTIFGSRSQHISCNLVGVILVTSFTLVRISAATLQLCWSPSRHRYFPFIDRPVALRVFLFVLK